MARVGRIGRTNLVRTATALREDGRVGKFLPNAITLLGLCSGATAIWFALGGDWKAGVAAIVFAAIFDALDGRLARLFGVAGAFGAQLDSLADLVSFGIAPGVLVYMWTLYHAQGAGWAFALIFCAASAIRLARFNVESAEHEPSEQLPSHFTGLPTPAAACLILLPMMLAFQFKETAFSHPWLSAAMIALMSWLMVSRVPTLSLKQFHVPQPFKKAAVAFGGILLGSAILWPWATLTVALLLYLLSIPIMASLADSDRSKTRGDID
ncbi:MAG TPA: CDP-diacylglycerol--serine O-phosphatidyltransferase [Rhizomicrobium sp.]|jgi:CDP-diacylglycerol--serine O-phosphatidyltransferase|nr:CDP-diacylglycerol--serine O-phosphatidyltransferase [Rhizomicrobium sp.]